VVLAPGTYPVNGGIIVPAGAQLIGDATTNPTIRLVANPGGTTRLVRFTGSSASVTKIRLDAGNLLALGCCSAVVMFDGNGTGGNLLEDVTVTGAPEVTGVYVLCTACNGNRMNRVDIHGNFYGVIFGPFNDAAHVNSLLSSQVHDNRCDGVTFMGTDPAAGRPGGYGVIDGSSLYRNGRDCENGIPGAAVYSAGNRAGARIINSRLYENCGTSTSSTSSASTSRATTSTRPVIRCRARCTTARRPRRRRWSTFASRQSCATPCGTAIPAQWRARAETPTASSKRTARRSTRTYPAGVTAWSPSTTTERSDPARFDVVFNNTNSRDGVTSWSSRRGSMADGRPALRDHRAGARPSPLPLARQVPAISRSDRLRKSSS
jgi:hypothetical protein